MLENDMPSSSDKKKTTPQASRQRFLAKSRHMAA
jgi:hypothetical protein